MVVADWRWRGGASAMHHSKTVALLWLLSALLFYFLFQMALRSSDSSRNSYPSASGKLLSYQVQFFFLRSFCIGLWSTFFLFQIPWFRLGIGGPHCTRRWLGIWMRKVRFFSSTATPLSLSRSPIFLQSRMDLWLLYLRWSKFLGLMIWLKVWTLEILANLGWIYLL